MKYTVKFTPQQMEDAIKAYSWAIGCINDHRALLGDDERRLLLRLRRKLPELIDLRTTERP